MNRARIAVVVVIASGVAAAAVGAGRAWFRDRPPANHSVAHELEHKELRNAARAVGLIARAAADPPAKEAPAPRPVDAPVTDAERPPPDIRWAARADATSNDSPLCGGKVCPANQFCCGPPECGHCASRLTGPRCPATCP